MFQKQSKSISLSIFLAICFTCCCCYHFRVVSAFHLSFGHRLPLKAVNTPQLNPDSHFIRPVECRNANNHSEAGICMFSIDCMQNKGVPLSVCKHKYFVGTCCRLPDYNNFVGIVYDLRDTETNHVLEAREVSSASTPTQTPTTTTAASPVVLVQSSLPNHHHQHLVAQQSNSKLVSVDPLLASEDTHSTKFIEASTKTPPVVATRESVDFVDERYRISSSSLFSNPTVATPTASSQQVSTSPKVGESARNSDGNSIGNDKILIELANSLTNHHQQQQQQPIRVQSAAPSEHKHAYEIVKADLDSEVLSTFNSVHSPPGTILSSRPPPLKQHVIYASTVPPTSHQAQSSESSNIYELISSSLAPTTTTTPIKVEQSTLSEVNSNSASRGSSKTSSTTVSAPVTTTSDQEFTLSTSSDYATSTPTPTTATSASVSASSDSNNRAQSTEGTQSSSILPYSLPSSSSSSSMSDLVSSTGSQTTTPFTVSLSTALLPNMSSRDPYAPTQQPATTTTTALVSSQTQSQSQSPSQQQTKSPPSPSSSPSASSLLSPAMIDPVATFGESSLANFSQLYSNQHSSASSATIDQPTVANTMHLRPSLHSTLHAASKIVTGSSSTNNLIPGLSNLQSAILSHIPFKIASGLSNYLQAAMKPTGTRPLISSNTAPSLQYQQQQHQQQQYANASRPHPTASTTSTTTTTTISASTTSSGAQSTTSPVVMMAPPSVGSGGVKFPGDNEINMPTTQTGERGISTVNFPTTAAAAAVSSSSSSSSNQQQQQQTTGYNVVRESQRVCGRPQVQQPSVLSPLAEGANKRMARIVGGNQSSFGQWPWMVSLRQWRKGAFLHKCGAALLNENWAITAAHCVEDVKVTDLLLRLGEFDVSNQEEPFPFIERRVKTVKSHPLFNPKTFEYDLALLKFQEPIKYERNIIPVCVPSGNDSYIDRMATVIGWGRLYEDGPLPDVIQHVDVPIITNNECEKMYKNAGYIEEIPDMFICAGISKGGRDSCEGDSGGPLTMVDHDGRSYLVGIISWGIGCALPSQPGVYTRITAFSGWINELAGS